MVDIGLMQNLCGMNISNEYSTPDLLDIYHGAMAEQFIGQEILVSHYGKLYYWSRQAKSSTAKVDYLVNVDDIIIPIEVKSGSAGRLKSLHIFLENYRNCSEGYVFSSRPYETLYTQKLKFIPLYYAFSATVNRNECRL